jgi:hypothetical protein
MDSSEATLVLSEQLAVYRGWTYLELCALIGAPKQIVEKIGLSGTRYYIDIYAVWDGRPNGEVRVFGCIDDGGWRALLPLSQAFIKAADGSTLDA